VVILQCTSQYPCPDNEANLLAIRALQKAFPQHQIGYSDHTLGTDACVAAVALGARVVEKHFTLNKKWAEGTDHILSLEPIELKAMIDQIRRVENLLGKEEKAPTAGESTITDFVRNR